MLSIMNLLKRGMGPNRATWRHKLDCTLGEGLDSLSLSSGVLGRFSRAAEVTHGPPGSDGIGGLVRGDRWLP